MTADTVIFDLGNVLVEYDWKSCLASFGFDKETYEVIANAVFLNEDWEKGDAGASPDEWLALFIENAPEYEKEIRRVYEELEGCIKSYIYTPNLIKYFRDKGYRIFYLSNYSEYLYEKTKDKLSFIETFDGGIFSYKEKCIKPNRAIYQILLERYDITAEKALFFDDRPDNIAQACELGIQGILFTTETVNKILG